jgi:predicted RNA-binding Zn-ribbon protein involved in translation (DUF1610 family)
MPADARRRSAWDYPDCPDCGSDVFVATAADAGAEAYRCELCGERFDE